MTDDPIKDFEAYDAKLQSQKVPICALCGERIFYDYAYHIRFLNEWWCEDCVENLREWIF